MNQKAQTLTCASCKKEYMPETGVSELTGVAENYCKECQEMQVHKRGSGRDEGQSHLQYGSCESCGSQTQYFPQKHKGHHIICPECERHNSFSSY